MHRSSIKLMADFRDRYLGEMQGCTVLDVGSACVYNQRTYRPLFEDYHYIGMDIVPGRNVDIVGYKDLFTYDVVISGQVMEHVKWPWEWLKKLVGLYRVYICIIAPNEYKEHRHPIDTFRYFPDGVESLFEWAEITPVEILAVGKDTMGIGR